MDFEGRLDETLKREPSWQPPPGFARRVTAAVQTEQATWPGAESRVGGGFVRAALQGALAASIVYVASRLLWWGVPSVTDRLMTTLDAYVAFVELASRQLVLNALPVAWISAAFSIALAASSVRRARA